MRIVLLGPPGAGKGTLAAMIKERFPILHISTGDIMRDEMKSASALGTQVKKYVDSGELVPDNIVIQIIENKLKGQVGKTQGYMLDGFPRTTKQAEALDAILNKMQQPIEIALCLEATLPIILMRLTGRRVCRQCGALYHMKNKPPKVAGKCDLCGGEVYQRPDDNEETIKKRMEVYTSSTAPIIEYYQNQGKLSKLTADDGADEIWKQFLDLFNARKK